MKTWRHSAIKRHAACFAAVFVRVHVCASWALEFFKLHHVFCIGDRL